jgi:formylglycine-generating enzyme required for sulfatase activity
MGAICLSTFTSASADVFNMGPGLTSLETVPVGNPGNAPDPGLDLGAVASEYRIGKYEITNSQYAEFLNAVAAIDPNRLYNEDMGNPLPGAPGHGGITRSGSPGSHTYSAVPGRENKPVSYVSWHDAARFANWLHNGQPAGEQGPATTEDGTYDMSLGPDVIRKAGAKAFLPTENEWYKAAYHKNGDSADYWQYPTQSDSAPKAEAPTGSDSINGSSNNNGAVGDLTDVGAYTAKPSDSPYGTFDQAGNAWEWSETDLYGDGDRGLRGGSYATPEYSSYALYRGNVDPMGEHFSVGFRVAVVPEPASILFLAAGGLMVLQTRQNGHR